MIRVFPMEGRAGINKGLAGCGRSGGSVYVSWRALWKGAGSGKAASGFVRGGVIGLLQAGASQSAAFLLCSKTGGAGVLWERLAHDGRYNGKLQGQWIGKEKERFHAPGAHHRRGDCGDFVGGGYAGYPWHDK